MAFSGCIRAFPFVFRSALVSEKLPTGYLKNDGITFPVSKTTNLKEHNSLFMNRSHSTNQNLFPPPEDGKRSKHDVQVEKVRNIMRKSAGIDSLEELIMIDVLQRLSIDHHFREEIKAALNRQHVKYCCSTYEGGSTTHDLIVVALRFRLLRNEGYIVDPNMFNKFKGRDGRFTEELREDTAGLLSLFEASQLRIWGEDVLDEANEFSRQHLHHISSMKKLGQHESKLIAHTIKYPCHKSLSASFLAPVLLLENLNVKRDWMKHVQALAEMDSNTVQMLIRDEVLQIYKRWTDIDFSKALEFARIQPLKWHMWSLAALPDMKLSEERIETTKALSLIYIIDDIFDVFGTLEDLTIFTEAINKREESILQELPGCMKLCFKVLKSTINELSGRTYVKYGYNPADSLWKAWADLCNAFLVEARWFASGELPTTEEYLRNGIVSTGVHVLLVHIFFLLGEEINHENVEFLNKNNLSTPMATILRLSDDLGSAKDENQDGHDGSIIACYMNEHCNNSVDDARNYVTSEIINAWKQLTKECLLSPRFSKTFCNACLGGSRMVSLMYNYDNDHDIQIFGKHMKLLLNGGADL